MITKTLDILRMTFISPELIVGLGLSVGFNYSRKLSEFALNILSEQNWSIVAILGIPIALLIACYKIGTDVLSPKGERRIILEWPEYWRLKYRVIFCLIVSALSIISSVYGYYILHSYHSVNGAIILVVAWAVAVTSLSSLALAKWKAIEILGE